MRAIRVPFRPERERLGVVGLGRREAVQRERTVAGFAKGHASLLRDRTIVAACSPGQLERRLPVVSDHLGVVVAPAEGDDPLRDRAMSLRALGPRDLAIGDVPNQGVCERQLRLARNGGAALPADEALSFEAVQHAVGVARAVAQNAGPEHLADYRG